VEKLRLDTVALDTSEYCGFTSVSAQPATEIPGDAKYTPGVSINIARLLNAPETDSVHPPWLQSPKAEPLPITMNTITTRNLFFFNTFLLCPYDFPFCLVTEERGCLFSYIYTYFLSRPPNGSIPWNHPRHMAYTTNEKLSEVRRRARELLKQGW
jgi:hypothetical protein